MSEKKEAPIFKKPRKNQSSEEVARELAATLIAQVNARRAAKGLPPLPKTHEK